MSTRPVSAKAVQQHSLTVPSRQKVSEGTRSRPSRRTDAHPVFPWSCPVRSTGVHARVSPHIDWRDTHDLPGA